MSRLILTEDAIQDFQQIYEYIAKDNAAAADLHQKNLKNCCRLLLEQPRIGSKLEDIWPDLRSIAKAITLSFTGK